MATRTNATLLRGDVLRLGGGTYGFGAAAPAFTLYDSTGNNATKDATLTVQGDGSFTRDLAITRNQTIGGTLGVTGAASFAAVVNCDAAGTGLAVDNNATIGGTLAVTSTSAFTGAASFAAVVNCDAAGTGLAVDNNATIGGTLAVTSTSAFTGAASFAAVVNCDAAGTGLAVDNNATVGGTLAVTGAASFAAVINADAAGTGLAVDNNATIGGTLAVTGAASFAAVINADAAGTGLAVDNNATIGGTLAVTGTSAFTAAASFAAVINADAAGTGLAVDNNATIGGTLAVTGTSAFTAAASFAAVINADAAGTGLAVDNNATIGGTLAVTGTSTFTAAASFAAVINADAAGTGLAVDNNATIGGTLTVTGTAGFAGAVTVSAAGTGLTVDNNASIVGTLGVTGAASFAAVVNCDAAGTGLAVDNNATIGGTLAVTGTSSFAAVNISAGSAISGQGNLTLGQAAPAVDTNAYTLSFAAGVGGAASVGAGKTGGQFTLTAGLGGAGAAAQTAGAGGNLVLIAGAAGANGGGGGAAGGSLVLRAGVATGAGSNGTVDIGLSNTAAVNLGCDLLPDVDGASGPPAGAVNIGSTTLRVQKIWAYEIDIEGPATIGSSSIAGTDSNTFTVNTDNTAATDIILRMKVNGDNAKDLRYAYVADRWVSANDWAITGVVYGAEGNSTTEPALYYANDGPMSIFPGTGTGVSASKVARVGDALDHVMPLLIGPVAETTLADTSGTFVGHKVEGHNTGGDDGKYWFIAYNGTTALQGFNVATDAVSGKAVMMVVRDGQFLKQGPAADAGADYEVIANDGTTPAEANSKNVIHFFEAITSTMNVWFMYHPKSKAVAA